jgi:regulator of sigma E protease
MSIPEPVVSAIAFVVALGVLVFVHELGHFLTAKRVGVKVERFSIGFGPVVWRWLRGETEYALSAIPLGGYVKMLGEDADGDEPTTGSERERAFSAQPPIRRGAIIFAGPLTNLVFAFVVYAFVYVLVGAEVPSTQPRVGGVAAGSPAEQAGVRAGDRVVSIGGTAIATWDELAAAVRGSKGAELAIHVDRDGQPVDVRVTPELVPSRSLFGDDSGESVYRIGIEGWHEWQRVGAFEGVGMAARHTATASWMVAEGLVMIATGRVSPRELGGPIAIAQAAGQQAKNGLRYFVSMLAFLSINLGVLNLLPVPALDGGHLVLIGIEGIRGRPLRPRALELAQQVGVLLLVSLMVFVFYNDIHRLVQ